MEFQPQILTNPYLGSVAYCCVAYLLDPPHSLLLSFEFSPPPQSSFAYLRHRHHRIVCPPGRPSSPSQHTKNPSPSLILSITVQDRLLLPYLAPATLVGSLSPNIIQRPFVDEILFLIFVLYLLVKYVRVVKINHLISIQKEWHFLTDKTIY